MGPMSSAEFVVRGRAFFARELGYNDHDADDEGREGQSLLARKRVLAKKKKGPHKIFDVRSNLEPLFINTIGCWQYRPREATEIENLFLASDYVKTDTDLATMEGAN